MTIESEKLVSKWRENAKEAITRTVKTNYIKASLASS